MKKQILSVVLAAVLCVSLALPASAAKLIPDIDVAVDDIVSSPFGIYQGNPAVSPEKTKPGEEMIIPILRNGFKNADGQDIWFDTIPATVDYEAVGLGPTVLELKANRISPRLHVITGNDVIKDYEFVSYSPTRAVPAQAALRIRFNEDLVSTEEVTYRFRIYLVFKGKMIDYNETWAGMVVNDTIDLYDADDYVNLENGDIGYSHFDSQDVKVHLGEGVNLFSDMFYGQKYYGVAHHYENEGQTYIMRKYSQITETYELKTINLKTHGDLVEFYRYENDPHYVYNLRGEYIGMTTDRLPYSTRYYLSPSFIEIEVTEAQLYNDIVDQYKVEAPNAAVAQFAKGLAENATTSPSSDAPADDVIMDLDDLID